MIPEDLDAAFDGSRRPVFRLETLHLARSELARRAYPVVDA